ncbi:Ank3, partial [Symbiodinium pilosum]
VTFSMFKTLKVNTGILIDQTYCPPSQRPEGCTSGPDDAIRIEDVHFRDFSGSFLQQDRKVLCPMCSDITYEGISLHPAVRENPWVRRR